MSSTETKLKEIVRQVLSMNESELLALLPGYQHRMENYSSISEWEEAVVLYFLINGCRIKSIQFCDRVNQLNSRKNPKRKTAEGSSFPRAQLSLVK
jgi:hypothetical protein